MSAPSSKGGQTVARQRILSLWFPYLSVERIMRQRLGRSWRFSRPAMTPPLVISHRENNTQRIAALDEQAERIRLKPGMGIADARAMHPAIDIVEADPGADRQLLESLADWCDRYTPLVAIEGKAGLFLDITGCVHLFGGEKRLLDDILARFFHQGFDARAGLASTAGAAWAAARFSGSQIVEPGQEAGLIGPLPLSALRLEPSTCASLESVGLRTADAVMAAPRAPLSRRFGKTLLLRLDQALGRLEETLSPRLPVAPLSVERQLAEPVSSTADIESLVAMLAATLKEHLERREEGARMLQLQLFRVDGAVSRIALGTSRPLRDPRLVQRLFHERLTALESDIDAGYGFDLVRLSVLVAARFEMDQGDLAGATLERDESIALLADRIGARLGKQAILRPVAVQSHLPERAVTMVPFCEGNPVRVEPQGTPPLPMERPIRLFRHPELLDVPATEVPEGPPLHFRWRRALYRVARAEGPERIAPEWWHEDADAPVRDYFRVEDADGRRYWLYRQGLYGASQKAVPRWFMHGLFA